MSKAVLTLALFFSCIPSVYCKTVYVKWDSPNNGPGNDWDHAYKSVRSALTVAVSGDEVWVAKGTYMYPITLKDGVSIYGGFDGTERDRAERNWKSNVTILDGDRIGSVVTSPIGATSATRVDGFTIRNGKGFLHGGGVYCSRSSPTIANNVIMANAAEGVGAGIYCYRSSAAIINNVIIGNSAAGEGGGIGGDTQCVLTITNNTIVANGARKGGGIHCFSSSLAVSNNIIAFNSSGIYGNSLALRNNDVYGNTRYDYSGSSPGVGDISVDPVLVSWQYGNIHIRPDSPCVNAGWNEAPGLSASDMDAQARVRGSAPDIGADESDDSNPPAGPYAVVRVSPDGDDENDGSSWSSAKKTISAGVTAASTAGGDVWVKSGIYKGRIILPVFV